MASPASPASPAAARLDPADLEAALVPPSPVSPPVSPPSAPALVISSDSAADFPPVPREPPNPENRPAVPPPAPALAAAVPLPAPAAHAPPGAAASPAPLIQPKQISIAGDLQAAPAPAASAAAKEKPSLFHRRTPSGSGGAAAKPPTAPAPQKASGNIFSRIFHIHDEEEGKKSTSPPAAKDAPAPEKKKENLVDKLFHRDKEAHGVRPDSAGSDRPPTPSALNTSPQLSPADANGSRSGTPATPNGDYGSGLGMLREMWSGSPAPSDSGQGGDVKRQPSLSRPPSSSNVSVSGSEKEREKPATLKRVGSEQYLAQKYGEVDGKVIGRGATSVVRLAHKKELPPGSTIANGDKGLDITYAIKEFRKRRRDESERDYVKKLSTEFCIGHSLHHPNVVDHIELLQTQQGAWCEVLEYCSGGDLCNLIQHGGLTYDEANGFFAQLVNGVAYLHTLGVAHKDLKPENLMLDGKGSLKITDFGSAEVFRSVWEKEAHKSHRLAGSEPYIAPEEFTEKEFDPRAVDVWACGIIYLTMIYNRIPWRSATGADPNYKFYLRCRAKYAASHTATLERRAPATGGSPKEASTATLISKDSSSNVVPEKDKDGKDKDATLLKTDLSRSNSAITRGSSDSGLKSHKSTQSSGAAEATAFPMLDHLPSGPRNLVFRMLDPNPDTRIAIEDVRRDAWFRNVVKSHIHDQWMERSDSETEKAMTAKKAQDSDGKPERAQKATSERAPSTTAGPHGPSKLGACVVPEGVGAAAGGAQGATSK